MAASFDLALTAAHAAASQQNYPPATLYMVATPIGNLADMSLRALHVLHIVEALACEDTRHTQALLRAYGIDRPASQLLVVHEHNESEAAVKLIARLRQGERIAYLSDAGTPCVSDPGARLAAAVRAAGLRVMPLPGASSITTLLSAAGANADDGGLFVFAGFLPTKVQERTVAVQALKSELRSVVLLESPHRIEALVQALAVLGERIVTLGRELTKQFEEITTCPASALPAWLLADKQRLRGEFVLLLHPVAAHHLDEQSAEKNRQVLILLLEHVPLKTAVQLTAEITGANRNTLYEAALQIKGNH